MAFVNPNKPSGLSPVKTLSGSDWNGKGNLYCIPSGDSTYNYFPGDLVGLGSNGTATTGGDANGVPYVTLATAHGGVVPSAVGVIIAVGITPTMGGPMIDPNNLQRVYAPITKAQNYYCTVADDPNLIFEIQEGGAGTNLTATTGCGNNADIILGAASTAATPTVSVSGTMINNGAVATTATYNLKLIRLVPRADNHFVTSPSTGGGYQKWWVLINNHQYRAGILTV